VDGETISSDGCGAVASGGTTALAAGAPRSRSGIVPLPHTGESLADFGPAASPPSPPPPPP